MQEIEPFYNWKKFYNPNTDRKSPFYGVKYNEQEYENSIYGYYIHPYWDFIGSETLYLKLLFVDYDKAFAVIELFGEWNDTLHNDMMYFKNNVIDHLTTNGIKHFALIGENIMNFHATEYDDYYAEWYDEVEEGWIAAINFRYFVIDEWRKAGIDSYVHYGGALEIDNWRTLKPLQLFQLIDGNIQKRLN